MFTTLAPAVTAGLAYAPAFGPMGHGGPGFFFPLLFIVPFVFLAFVAVMVTVGRRFWWRRHHEMGSLGAESVLRERYARGEIDESEYRARLEVLRSNPR
ncbi:SHOCT domain-containing protein [Psychromicrobium xiongbiense]|uniref:SHOCT domain-containing protein n=1 Tax=Psychromicrobium xiongbiense TaxID=3051184 RepID=UPI0025573BEF|nr:SHOCT domain-containing protein [Psychromicrobium sp. YIM S02556]